MLANTVASVSSGSKFLKQVPIIRFDFERALPPYRELFPPISFLLDLNPPTLLANGHGRRSNLGWSIGPQTSQLPQGLCESWSDSSQKELVQVHSVPMQLVEDSLLLKFS